MLWGGVYRSASGSGRFLHRFVSRMFITELEGRNVSKLYVSGRAGAGVRRKIAEKQAAIRWNFARSDAEGNGPMNDKRTILA